MPIYEYRCAECGHELEVWAKISDAPPVECPSCHAASLRKAVSRTTFSLKGGGWYAHGYGAGKGAAKSTESTSTPAPASTSPAAGGEKSASAPEPAAKATPAAASGD